MPDHVHLLIEVDSQFGIHRIEIIQRYDSTETLFYCDPPYPYDSRGDSKAYAYEMTDGEHRELAREEMIAKYPLEELRKMAIEI